MSGRINGVKLLRIIEVGISVCMAVGRGGHINLMGFSTKKMHGTCKTFAKWP